MFAGQHWLSINLTPNVYWAALAQYQLTPNVTGQHWPYINLTPNVYWAALAQFQPDTECFLASIGLASAQH